MIKKLKIFKIKKQKLKKKNHKLFKLQIFKKLLLFNKIFNNLKKFIKLKQKNKKQKIFK